MRICTPASRGKCMPWSALLASNAPVCARLVCPHGTLLRVPFGCLSECVPFGDCSGFLCGRVPQEEALWGTLSLIPCMPAHPVPLIALSEGTQVAPTFVRRCYDRMNTRFSWDCPFRMNNFPLHRNILYCIQQQYIKEKRDFAKKTERHDLCWEGKEGKGIQNRTRKKNVDNQNQHIQKSSQNIT
jgi:hypothetical protein